MVLAILGVCSFFVLATISIVILFTFLDDALYYEIKSKEDKLSKYTMTFLKNLSQIAVLNKFKEAKFKPTADGYYRKKGFSFYK